MITWYGKNARTVKGYGIADVVVSKSMAHGKTRTYFYIARDKASKLDTTGYIQIGLDTTQGRIYFAPCAANIGWKLSEASTTTKRIFAGVDLSKYCGEYKLHKDEIGYFIDVRR